MRSGWTIAAAAGAAAACLGFALADPPGPALPPINPAVARLDQTVNGLDGPGGAVAYREADGLLVAVGEQGSVQYWRKDVVMGVRVGDTAPHSFKAHSGPITSVTACGAAFATAGADGKVVLWSLPDEKALQTLDAGTVVRALAASPDGKVLASAGDDGAVQLWHPATGKPGMKLAGATDWLLAVAFSPDGKTIAAAGYDGSLRTWDAVSGKKALEVPVPPPAPPPPPPAPPPPAATPSPANVTSALAFSPDGKLIAVGAGDGQIYLYQSADGKPARTLPGHTSSVTALLFHPGGALLVSASKDRTVRLWNPAAGQAIKTLEGHGAWVQGATFAAQSTRLASVGADQTVRLWDLTDPKK